jgi:hypothetical protein
MYSNKSILASLCILITIAVTINSLPLQATGGKIRDGNILKRDSSVEANNKEEEEEDKEINQTKTFPTIQELLSNQKPLGNF